MYFTISSAKRRSSYLGLNLLISKNTHSSTKLRPFCLTLNTLRCLSLVDFTLAGTHYIRNFLPMTSRVLVAECGLVWPLETHPPPGPPWASPACSRQRSSNRYAYSHIWIRHTVSNELFYFCNWSKINRRWQSWDQQYNVIKHRVTVQHTKTISMTPNES